MLELGSNYSVSSATEGRGNVLLPEYDLGLARRRLSLSATKVLALATLFLATTFAHAEWKEFTFPDGNFRIVFPSNPQRLRGSHRNLH
jgi:hypothetical protein